MVADMYSPQAAVDPTVSLRVLYSEVQGIVPGRGKVVKVGLQGIVRF